MLFAPLWKPQPIIAHVICTMWGLQPIILHAICTLLEPQPVRLHAICIFLGLKRSVEGLFTIYLGFI